jgi:hypothetical protein
VIHDLWTLLHEVISIGFLIKKVHKNTCPEIFMVHQAIKLIYKTIYIGVTQITGVKSERAKLEKVN